MYVRLLTLIPSLLILPEIYRFWPQFSSLERTQLKWSRGTNLRIRSSESLRWVTLCKKEVSFIQRWRERVTQERIPMNGFRLWKGEDQRIAHRVYYTIARVEISPWPLNVPRQGLINLSFKIPAIKIPQRREEIHPKPSRTRLDALWNKEALQKDPLKDLSKKSAPIWTRPRAPASEPKIHKW